MQLETGKSKNGLVGTLRNIVREEGYVSQLDPSSDSRLTKRTRAGRLYRGKELPMLEKNTLPKGLPGLVPPLLLEAPKRAVKLLVL
jgi:solute carrier family 25 2-oxodicarboxylate transporter 21